MWIIATELISILLVSFGLFVNLFISTSLSVSVIIDLIDLMSYCVIVWQYRGKDAVKRESCVQILFSIMFILAGLILSVDSGVMLYNTTRPSETNEWIMMFKFFEGVLLSGLSLIKYKTASELLSLSSLRLDAVKSTFTALHCFSTTISMAMRVLVPHVWLLSALLGISLGQSLLFYGSLTLYRSIRFTYDNKI